MAAETWKKIHNYLQQTDDSKRSYSWWQAKYFELLCVSKLPGSKKVDIIHAAEILVSSYSNIEPFWARKLNELKK